MARPGVSERSKIDSFIVMDLMRDAAAKQRELEASGIDAMSPHRPSAVCEWARGVSGPPGAVVHSVYSACALCRTQAPRSRCCTWKWGSRAPARRLSSKKLLPRPCRSCLQLCFWRTALRARMCRHAAMQPTCL